MTTQQCAIVEQTTRRFAGEAFYWLIGGVVECAQYALDRMHLKALEFTGAIVLMTLGLFMMLPLVSHIHTPFIEVMQSPFLGASFYVPLWLSGLLYVIIARATMHFTLHNNAKQRRRWLAFSAMTWGIMLMFNLLSGFAEFPNAAFMLMCFGNLYLMDRANRDCFVEVQKANGTRTKAE